jgi:predicted transcriptional regulator
MSAIAMHTTQTDDEREAKLQAIAEARADLATGRTVNHADVCRWLDSWGTPNELPPPEPCK